MSSFDARLGQTTSNVRTTVDGPPHASARFPRRIRPLTHFVQLLFVAFVTVVYQSPKPHKAFAAVLESSRRDPFLLLLLFLATVKTAQCLFQISSQISGLSDDTVMLETALGDILHLPSHYWQAHELFHGFLNHHFRDRPGSLSVAQRSYRIHLGGSDGRRTWRLC